MIIYCYHAITSTCTVSDYETHAYYLISPFLVAAKVRSHSLRCLALNPSLLSLASELRNHSSTQRMPRPLIPRKYYLLVHDCLKKAERDGVINAFASSRSKYQSDMVIQLDRKQYPVLDSETTHAFALKLQQQMPHVLLKPKKLCIDLEFPVNEIQMSVQIGWKDVTIEDINAQPEYEDRVPLRSSLGFDEERFMNSAPRLASISAVLLEKWALGQFGPESAPPAMYWLVHSYRMMEAFPLYDHHQIVFGSVADKFHTMFEKAPLDNPFCPGEDLNTLRAARNANLAMSPYGGSPVPRSPRRETQGGIVPAAIDDAAAAAGQQAPR